MTEKKVTSPTIFGSTTINHAARILLKMNASEYVLMDYIYRCVQKKKEMEVTETYRQTGFTTDQQEILLRSLVMKGFIWPDQVSPPRITSKWESAFADLKAEFDNLFWKKADEEGKMKVFWPGSNKKSFVFYHTIRKQYSREFLIEQRDEYARFLEMQSKNGFDQATMMAERWLNPRNENYLTDWKQMADDVEKKTIEKEKRQKLGRETTAKSETIISAERKKQYEQDSNQ